MNTIINLQRPRQRKSFFSGQYGMQTRHEECTKLKDVLHEHLFANLQMSVQNEIISHHSSSIQCMEIDKVDYRYLLSGARNGTIALYDLHMCSTSHKTKSLPLKPQHFVTANTPGFSTTITSVQWYPQDCGLFLTSNFNGEVFVYDTNTFTPVVTFPFTNTKVYCAKFRSTTTRSDSTPLIAAGLDDGTIHIIDLNSGGSTHVINGHNGHTVTAVDWSPIHSYQLCSASTDGEYSKMMVWHW